MAKKQAYGNESITTLKGAERVRKRPAVIFGSDGLDGCEHAVFEILSNAIDEAREGYGKLIIVTRYADRSIEVEDFGRGCPVDWNEKEQRYNWELVFCEMYAGGKYNNNASENYEYSLGLNGLGTCATQYASEYFNARIFRDGFEYHLHFKRGEIDGQMEKKPADRKKTGSLFHWKPDLEVFTDIDIPVEYYLDTLKRQAVVNAGVTFRFRNQAGSKFETTEFCYEHGILDYITELTDGNAFTMPQYWETERRGRDRADKPEYKVKITAALCFSRNLSRLEYYHNSSWLEHGGAPDKAARSGFVSAIDAYLKQNGKYAKNESKITFQDVADCLVLVTNCFSTQTSYENQTKKSINNRFIQEAMTEFFRSRLQVYFLENKQEADRIAEQVLINKRSRETAERARITVKKKLSGNLDIANRVQKFVDCRSRDASRRERNQILEGIQKLNANGATIIYTSHYMEEVEQICTRIAIMDQGKKIAEGTKEELKQIIKNTETITIEVPMLPEIVLQSIKALEHVYQVTYEQEELKIYCSGGVHNLVDVLHILQEQQVAIGRVYTTLPTLNDVFLEITGKALRDQEG